MAKSGQGRGLGFLCIILTPEPAFPSFPAVAVFPSLDIFHLAAYKRPFGDEDRV